MTTQPKSRPTMTRPQFELIAEVIRECRAFRLRDYGHGLEPVGSTAKERARYGAQLEALQDVAKDFADRLATTHVSFDRERFLAACDPSTEYRPKSRPVRHSKYDNQAQREMHRTLRNYDK